MSRNPIVQIVFAAAALQLARGLYEIHATSMLFGLPLKALPAPRLGAMLLDWWTRPATWVALVGFGAALYFPIVAMARLASDRSRLPRKNLSAGDLTRDP